MNRDILRFLLFLTFGSIIFVSCKDDLLYDPEYNMGDGTACVMAEVSFNPLISALDSKSRSAGNSITSISKLQVVVYNEKHKFVKSEIFSVDDNSLDVIDADKAGANTSLPNNYNSTDQAEAATAKASFKLHVPYGKYYVYVVANYDGEDFTIDNVPTPDDLKSVTVKWSSLNISENAQMFGSLATDSQKDYDDEAPLLTLNKETVSLHAWIKRLASKLTLVFDGSGLHEGIFVYINKATIKDIPRYCHFGSNNGPLANVQNPTQQQITDSLIATGESLFYHADGSITSVPGTDENQEVLGDADGDSETNFQYAQNNWLEINKSTIAGAVSGTGSSMKIHGEDQQALYFYENCQGVHTDKDKKQNPDHVGTNITNPDQPDYKDDVPAGTYIEVEGYYSANYNGYLSSGPIKYRFMLGQDTEYNYNALRNRHYKLTLCFKGYANQPDWHIEYYDEDPGLYPPEEYYMSYQYNIRQEMPIRLTGNVTKVTMQIVENNWAPYDASEQDLVPPAEVGTGPMRFQWNKTVYSGNYDYGLHPLTSSASSPYGADILNDKPDWVQSRVTPIWVGFLALQAPSGYSNYDQPLPTGVYNTRSSDPNQDNFYSNKRTRDGMKNYYYGSGDVDEYSGVNLVRKANTIPLYQNVYNIDKSALSSGLNSLRSGEDNDKDGRNGFTAFLNEDNSVTIYVPLFTQPKSVGYITGFSGNNPYESYQRRAIVKITAEYELKDDKKKIIVKYIPIYQMRRIINPKAVWRKYDSKESFDVKLMVLDSPTATQFTNLESNGEWEAWVCSDYDDYTPATSGTFTLEGADAYGKVHGITGSNINFRIKFAGDVASDQAKCGKIIVRYHGLTCEHSIYVRQGYNEALRIGDNTEDKLWSSYAVYSFDDNATAPEPLGNKKWELPSNEIEGLTATLTQSPLALGTLFKRCNYSDGIGIINNEEFGPLVAPGPLKLTSGETKKWEDIYGLPLLGYTAKLPDGSWGPYYGDAWDSGSRDEVNENTQWSSFKSGLNGAPKDIEYDVPTLADFETLMFQGFGVGVMYSDGATVTADNTEDAFGFFDSNNNTTSNTKGMRGFVVYNLKNHNQVFFPIGYRGIGRRTIQNAVGDMMGTLRYGAQSVVLDQNQSVNNQYRPITYNIPANCGAIYWVKAPKVEKASFDMNFFDLTFGPMDNGANLPDYGDALLIKPVIKQTESSPALKGRKKGVRKK